MTTSRSLSPLSKDPLSVGKLINKQLDYSDDHEQTHFEIRNINNPEMSNSIGVNTSRTKLKLYDYQSNSKEQEIKPITQSNQNRKEQMQMTSTVFRVDVLNEKTSQPKLEKWGRKSGFFKKVTHRSDRKSEKSPVGTIFKQNKAPQSTRSAPKDHTYNFTSPQLPSINKIDTNLKGFRSFIGETHHHVQADLTSSSRINRNSKSQIGKTYHSNSFNHKSDPEENQKLHKRCMDRTTVRFPHFSEKQFEEQSMVNNTSDYMPKSRVIQKKLQVFDYSQNSEQDQSSLAVFTNTHDFIYSPEPPSPFCFKLDLRTPVSRLKQLLIQSNHILHLSFMVPQIFFQPPSHNSTAKDLHNLMIEIFKYVDLTPQIVSIKKYVNCVMMCEKRLCVLWAYTGKVYFGGWDRNISNDNSSRMLTQGNKHGIGMQWIPSRYIYYGQFKDNKKEGYGIMKKANKQVYLGEWKSNQREGWGKVYNMLGQLVQDGHFIEGCFVRQRERSSNIFNQ